jgi:hypothetical protein
MKIERRLKRLNGYQKMDRNRHILASFLKFTDPEYRLLDFYNAFYDWDKKHVDTYGHVEITDKDAGRILNWSTAKVCRTRKELIQKGLISTTDKSTYKMTFLQEPQTFNNTPDKTEVARMETPNSNTETVIAPMQRNGGYRPENPLVSFKGDVVSLRSDKEYEDIWEDMGKPDNFTPDDMKFIDWSVYEATGIKPSNSNKYAL